MPSRVWEFQVTVPIGTAPANPHVTQWLTEDNLWNSIELTVPPGHNGLTGIRVMKGDVSLLPYNSLAFIVADDYSHEFIINDYVATADVTVETFNNGSYQHTFYLRLTVSDYNVSGSQNLAAIAQPILVGGISQSPDPLSPDAILGPVVTDQLSTGAVTADDLAPQQSADASVAPDMITSGG